VLDLAKRPVSLLDLAKELGVPAVEFIDAVSNVPKLVAAIQALPPDVDDIPIQFGSYKLGGADVRVVKDLKEVPPVPEGPPLGDVLYQLGELVKTGTPGAAESKAVVESLKLVPGGGFKIPVWENPASLVGLFTGQDVVLATYDMPTLKAEFAYSQFFPIVGPVGVKLGGSLGGSAHFGFGYDTAGIKQFKEHGFDPNHAIDLLDGFYVSDRANADGTGDDVPEVTLAGGLAAALELNAAIGEAGVEGGITATAGLNLNDPNQDGKVRLGEIVDILSTSPLCLFDASGH
jgi:hypothetical protein